MGRRKRLLCGLALLVMIGLVPVRLHAEEGQFVVDRVSDSVYVIRQAEIYRYPVEGNVTLIINEQDCVVVDSNRTPSSARAVIALIREITPKPVRYLINTHWHGDHHHGNFVYRQEYPGVEILSSAPAREEILRRGRSSLEAQIQAFTNPETVRQLETETTDSRGRPLHPAFLYRRRKQAAMALDYGKELERVILTPPTMTFEGGTTLYRGGREIRVFNNGYGNTAGDTLVYLPREKIIITGDLMVSTVPFMFGSVPTGWLARLHEIEALEFDVLVPGHGPLQHDRSFLELHIRLLESLLAQVRSAVDRGLSLEETVQAVDLKEFREAYARGNEEVGFEFDLRITASAIRDAYNELRGNVP